MATVDEIKQIFPNMIQRFQADKAGDLNAVIKFNLTGDNGGVYWLKIADGQCETGEGEIEANMTMTAKADDFHALVGGELNPMSAFMMGKIKVTDVGLGMKMMTIFQMG